MTEFEELLGKLKELKIIQKNISWEECLPQEIWHEDFESNFKIVDEELDTDKRRHYETSVSVIEIYGRFLGIKHITNLYSESSSCEDCYVSLEFFEMKETIKTTYTKI